MFKKLQSLVIDVAIVAAAWRLFFSGSELPWLALWLGLVYAGWRFAVAIYHGLKMQTSGYLAPSPSLPARIFYRGMTSLLGKLAVGPVEVEGRENLPAKGRVILVPNHTFPLDFTVVANSTGKSCRFMTVTSELTGLRGIFGAWTGAIPVNTKVEGGGARAVEASVKALAESSTACLLIFPQGKLVYDNVLRREDFKNGFARIAAAVAQRVPGEPIYIVPMGMHYKRSEADRKPLGWLLSRTRKMFGQGTQFGARAVIGKAIRLEELPTDPDKATDVVFAQVQSLLGRAQGATR